MNPLNHKSKKRSTQEFMSGHTGDNLSTQLLSSSDTFSIKYTDYEQKEENSIFSPHFIVQKYTQMNPPLRTRPLNLRPKERQIAVRNIEDEFDEAPLRPTGYL